MNKILLTLFSLMFISGITFAEQKNMTPTFHYKFDKKADVKLMGNAKIVDGVLRLDGKNSFAIIPNSKNMNLTEKGMTLVGVVKFNDSSSENLAPESYDTILGKGREFVFGRYKSYYYGNFNNGKSWVAPTMGGKAQKDKWLHLVAVFERLNDVAQGDVGYTISIYVNGDRIAKRRFLDINPRATEDNIEIGKGLGGGIWYFNGDISEVSMYDRVLTENEIAKLLDSNSKVKVVKKGFTTLDKNFITQISQLKKNSKVEVNWVLNSLLRMGETKYSVEKINKVLSALKNIKNYSGIVDFAKTFNSVQDDFTIITTDSIAVLLAKGSAFGAYPIGGILNRQTSQDIFGEQTFSWEIFYQENGKKSAMYYNDKNISWKINSLKNTENGATFQIVWNSQSPKFTMTSNVNINNARIESDFSVKNSDKKVIINEVTYPAFNFAQLKGNNENMIFPWMSGVLVNKPMENQFVFGQERVFPSGGASLQFAAYYDDVNGIYFGFEDGLARTKTYKAAAKRNSLNISWTSPAPRNINSYGGNDFSINGKAVIELYNGKWFEAGQIYKRFLEKEASWWIKDLPRKDTPQWFKDNTLWILAFSFSKTSTENLIDEIKFFKKYFDLPISIHWYGWDDRAYGWPHLKPRDFVVDAIKEMKKLGVNVKIYSNGRLWKDLDGPNKQDYQFKSHGLKYAVKNINGTLNTEVYGDVGSCTVMCPAAKGWQDTMVKITDRLISYGVDAVYHDQVATAAPKLCFDKTHGHKLNDGATWLEEGYNLIFDKIRKQHPNICQTTEEAADPYLKQMDGYMVWRWTDDCQIPLFQSIYSGRTQFVGRQFNHTNKGDEQSFFSKVAQQLVNAEQIGWFMFSEIREPKDNRLFVKKAMHIRKALLSWFNEGEMLAPIEFKNSVEKVKSKWGGNVPQVVTMDKVATNSFRRLDGSKVYLFINTVDENLTLIPKIVPEKTIWICKEGAEKPVKWVKNQSVNLTSRGFEVWVEGSENQANKIQETLRKIATFEVGKKYQLPVKRNKYAATDNSKGKWISPEKIVDVVNCKIAKGKTHVGWMLDNAVMNYGIIDFGNKAITQLEIHYAVSADFEGGTINFVIQRGNEEPEVVATIVTKDTGSFNDYKIVGLNLKKPLTGKYNVKIQTKGAGACNLKDWRFITK